MRGLNDRNKRLAVFNHFQNSNFSIICLQETKTTSAIENQIRKEWYNHNIIINSTPSSSPSGGCMILVNSTHISIIESLLSPDGRCISINIDFHGDKYHVVCAYFPIVSSEKRPFITSLYPIVSSCYPVVFAGDFNLVIDPIADRFPPKHTKDQCWNDLDNLIKTFDLIDACRELYPTEKFFSFRRGLSKSRIDRVYTSHDCTIKEYKQYDFPFSDHDIVAIDIENQNLHSKGRGYWRNSAKVYEYDDFLENFKDFWSKNVMLIKKRFTGAWWVECKFQIKRFLIKYNKKKMESKDSEIKNLKIALERKKFLASLNPTSQLLMKNYDDCKKDLAKRQIAFIKEKIFHDKVVDMSLGDMPTKAFFEKIKLKKSNPEPKELYVEGGILEKNPDKLVHVAKEFFEKKFKPMRKCTEPESSRLHDKFLEKLPTSDVR